MCTSLFKESEYYQLYQMETQSFGAGSGSQPLLGIERHPGRFLRSEQGIVEAPLSPTYGFC